MTVAALFSLFVLLAVAGGVLLYSFVRREREGERMDRESAERAARRDTDDAPERR